MITLLRRRQSILYAVLAMGACDIAILATDRVFVRTVGALGLAALLPGALLVALLYSGRQDDAGLSPIESLVLAVGLGLVYATLTGLALHYLPGPIPRRLVLGVYNLSGLALIGVLALHYPPRWHWPRPGRREALALLLLLGVALYTRGVNLGYAEFQGDEVAVLHKAAAAIQGHDEALFTHRKGPAEILLPLVPYALTGRMNESAGRLPFALASIASILGLYALGTRHWGQRAGWWAALLVALNGFFVAFGRIIQYQSLVLLYSVLALTCALWYDARGRRRDLWLTAVFCAAGLLSHTDAAFGACAAAFVVIRALVRDAARREHPMRRALGALVGPVLLSGAMLAAFYVPFSRYPQFASTQGYLAWRMGHPPYNNLHHLLTIGTVYNSIYFVGGLGIAMLCVVLWRLRGIGRPRWLWPTLFVVAMGSAVVAPNIWVMSTSAGARSLFGAPFALAMGALFVWGNRWERPAWRAALIWFGLPFLAYTFWFRDPRTHLYILFPGASLLIGVELGRLESRLVGGTRRARWAWAPYVPLTAWLVISAAYLQIMFVGHDPEYRRTYPANRIPFYWAPYGDTLPDQGLFGFPYRAGWKVIGELYETGQLQGDYDSNEEGHIITWYTRGARRCAVDPRYYFIAENVQDVQQVPLETIEKDYVLVGQVRSEGAVTLRIYEREPASFGSREFAANDVRRAFDQRRSGPTYHTGLRFTDPLWDRQHTMSLRFGPQADAARIELLGYSLDRPAYHPGQAATLTLYWRALAPIEQAYTVFTHIEDPGVLWSQKDAPPQCGHCPTSEWQVGEIVVDEYVLVLPQNIPLGGHAIVVGLYARETGERLDIRDANGVPVGQAATLGLINIVAP